jgi:uncharacterized protein (DUF58 family)
VAGLARFLSRRIQAWARRRQGDEQPPFELQSRRLYILPTRTGLAFGLLMFIMLVAGLNYTNSLALLLTFVLAAFVLVGMHECQHTLRGLRVESARASDAFAGADGEVGITLSNPSAQPRRALALACAGGAPVACDLDPGQREVVRLSWPAGHRGLQRIDRIELATTAPFGLFRCWTWLYLPLEAHVYPRPLGTRPLPAGGAGSTRRTTAAAARGEDSWAGLREYQPGDSTRGIAWKAYARGAPLLVSQYQGEAGRDCLLSFDALAPLDTEARLSQLSRWVGECARLGCSCALELPGVEFPVGAGAEHYRAMWRALALHGT